MFPVPFSVPLTWLGTAAQLWMLVMLLEVTPEAWSRGAGGSEALECELIIQADESEETGMKMPLSTGGRRACGPLRPFTLATGFSPRCAPTPQWRLVPSPPSRPACFHRILHPYPRVFTSVSQQKPFTAESSDFHFKKKKSSLHLHLFCCLRTFFSSSEVPQLTTHWVFGEIFWVSILS